MRIVIDLEATQKEIRERGVSPYTLAITKAILRNQIDHEIILVLNGMLQETIEPLRLLFKGHLPAENIRLWHGLAPVNTCEQNHWHYQLAEHTREALIANLKPDIVLITSLFEGLHSDDSVFGIKTFKSSVTTAVIVHELIPFKYRKYYLNHRRAQKRYLNKLKHLYCADLVLTLSESSRKDILTHKAFSPQQVVTISSGIESTFSKISIDEKNEINFRKRFGLNGPFILYTASIDPHKNLKGLIQAYTALPMAVRMKYQLVIICNPPNKEELLKTLIKQNLLLKNEVILTGFVTDSEQILFYNLCTFFVYPSFYEGFCFSILDAMACGCSVIGSNTSSIKEIIVREDALFNPNNKKSITSKMLQVLTDDVFRQDLEHYSLEHAQCFSWDKSAKQALNAIEAWYKQQSKTNKQKKNILCNDKNKNYDLLPSLIQKVSQIIPRDIDPDILLHIAKILDKTLPPHRTYKQLFVDISELVKIDYKTGIHRVVRSILLQLLNNTPNGFHIEPVYASQEHGYRYARSYMRTFWSSPQEHLNDKPIEYQAGDIFLCPDLQYSVVFAQQDFYRILRREGVVIYFLVHDLLPILMPEYCCILMDTHHNWLKIVTENNDVLCVSKSVADTLIHWIEQYAPERRKYINVSWFHLGADIENSAPTYGIPDEAHTILNKLENNITFLMIGTIEPRKGHKQTLTAFDELWAKGHDVNLAIIGKKGWKMDEFIETLSTHPQKGKKLFFLGKASDEYMEKIYGVSNCIIMASEGEGFGLPLIEAARHKLPIIARDIPVFREIAQENAYYFSGTEAKTLTHAIEQWIMLQKNNLAPCSENIPWLTWAQSTQQLLERIL